MVQTIELPYTADLPAPYLLAARILPAGAVHLSWRATSKPNHWKITGLATDPLSVDVPANYDGNLDQVFEVTVSAGDVGTDGEHTAVLCAVNGIGRSGASESVTFTNDSLAPSPPSGLIGIPF